MKLHKQKKHLGRLAVTLLGSTVLLTSPAYGQDSPPSNNAEAKASVETSLNEEAKRQTDDKRAKLLKRAINAVTETDTAIAALAEDDSEKALEALARATGQLDIILAREPSLAIAPIDVRTTRLDTLGSVDDVKQLRKDIQEAVREGQLQEARLLLRDFGSEVRMTTTNLPLATYPEALKTAAALIDDGEIEAARVVLDTALGTFVIRDVIAPIPLIRAQFMLDQAEQYLAGDMDTEEEPLSQDKRVEAAQVLRSNAAYQIDLAKTFGYGDKGLYKTLENDLDKLKKQVHAKGETGGLFGSLRRQIDNLTASNEPSLSY